MSKIEAFILAGGASSRMGTDKAALRLGGLTFVERIAGALRAVTSDICLVSSRHVEGPWGLPVIHDLRENCGAMGGLHAALTAAKAAQSIVVSCDLPFVTGRLFERLVTFSGAEFDAIAPVQEDGRPQPLCAIYQTAPCRQLADELLLAGELRPRKLLARARTHWVPYADLIDLAGSAFFFMNVNTPEEHARAQRAAGILKYSEK